MVLALPETVTFDLAIPAQVFGHVDKRAVPRTGGPAISAVAEWALRHLDRPLTVDGLAHRAGYAPRTLARR